MSHLKNLNGGPYPVLTFSPVIVAIVLMIPTSHVDRRRMQQEVS